MDLGNFINVDFKVEHTKDNIIYIKNNKTDLYGYVILSDDLQVSIFIGTKYQYISEFSDGIAIAKLNRNSSNNYNLIDLKGNKLLRKNYFKIEKIDKDNYKVYLLNKFLIEERGCNLEYAIKQGIVNRYGEIIYKPQYNDDIIDYKEGTILLKQRNSDIYTLKNIKTKKIYMFKKYIRLSDIELLIENESSNILKKINYNLEITDSFVNKWDEIHNYKEEYAVVIKDKLYGLIDKNGNEIIKPEYQFLHYLGENTIVFRKDINHYIEGSRLILDKEINYYICKLNSNYYKLISNEQIRTWANKRIGISKDGLCGVTDYNGNEIINCEYESITNLKNGYFKCDYGNHTDLIDKEGIKKFRYKDGYSIIIIKDNLMILRTKKWKNDKYNWFNYVCCFDNGKYNSYKFYCENVLPFNEDSIIIEKEVVKLSNKDKLYNLAEISWLYKSWFDSFTSYSELVNFETEEPKIKILSK